MFKGSLVWFNNAFNTITNNCMYNKVKIFLTKNYKNIIT